MLNVPSKVWIETMFVDGTNQADNLGNFEIQSREKWKLFEFPSFYLSEKSNSMIQIQKFTLDCFLQVINSSLKHWSKKSGHQFWTEVSLKNENETNEAFGTLCLRENGSISQSSIFYC